MSLSQKIAAALDENTRAYVLPCTVTVEDGPNRLTLHLTALDTRRRRLRQPRVRHDRPPRLVVRGPQGLGRPARRPGDLPDGAAHGPRDRRRRRRGPDPQPEPHAPRRAARLSTRSASSGRARCGWSASPSTRPPASAVAPPASSPARSSNAWPTTSPPAPYRHDCSEAILVAGVRISGLRIPGFLDGPDSRSVVKSSTPGIWNPSESRNDESSAAIGGLQSARAQSSSESIGQTWRNDRSSSRQRSSPAGVARTPANCNRPWLLNDAPDSPGESGSRERSRPA